MEIQRMTLKEKILKKKLHLAEIPEDVKKQEKIKSALAKAFLDDEASRLESQKRSIQYVKDIDEKNSNMPEWSWNLLWFAIGILFVMTVENFVLHTTIVDWFIK